MSLKVLRNIFIFGTLAFALVLIGMTIDSLRLVTSKRTAEVTDQVVRGKKMWQHRNCQDCHTLLGIGGYLAPELTKEASLRDPGFLTAWLKDPQSLKPGTTMPNQRLAEAEILDLIAFLTWVSKIDTNNWPPQPIGFATGGGTPEGSVLFAQKGCPSCHMINGKGATGPGPDLSHIASQPYDQLSNTLDFLFTWIKDPKAVKPATLMPTIPMTDEERRALVKYLVSLK